MIGMLAIRSLLAHPVRSAVLAAGFGFGVGVMAILLGVAEVVLEQAQAPALVGGGDVLIRTGPQVPAQLILSGTLQSEGFRPRVRAAAPFRTSPLYLVRENGTTRVTARGGIPSLERLLDDAETGSAPAWRDSPDDVAWTRNSPEEVLKQIDRFHPIPPATEWSDSWAEWLYFNGRAADARFYLTFLAGPRLASGRRAAGVRLQLERDGQIESFGAVAEAADEDLADAPDLTIGKSSVRLDGMRYRIRLDLADEGGRPLAGEMTLEASPGRLVPPVEISGARGWRTGYVVPVTSGPLDGQLVTPQGPVSFANGRGYHDHNWGFWAGVSWQWGQVQHDDLSFIYGRVFPPPDAADPERVPGFVGALGPNGPIGYATDVRITETNNEQGAPRTISVRAAGTAFDLDLRFDVVSIATTNMLQGPLSTGLDFLQLRGQYSVKGHAADRAIDFTAPGAAETFRGTRPPR
jgi:hypothetical protein